MRPKQIFMIWILALMLALSACAAQPAAVRAAGPLTPATPASPIGTVLMTGIGDLTYLSAHFADEVNGVLPGPGCRILLIVLERPDGTAIDVQQFVDARMEISIRGDDGSQTPSSMSGLVGQQFAVGFQVPQALRTYQLVWGDNPALNILPDL